MKRIFLIAAVGVSLVACQRVPNFVKPGANAQDFARTKLNCIQVANASTPGYMAIGSPLMVAAAAAGNQEARQSTFETCMQADGWYITGYSVPGAR